MRRLLLGAAAAALACLTAATAAAREGTGDAARITVDASGPATRVVVTFPMRRVACDVRPVDEGVRLTCLSPFAFDPASTELGDDLLKSWRSPTDRSVVFVAGPGFRRYETFELKNPARVVIDFSGERSSPAAATTLPRATTPTGRAERIIVLDPGHGGIEMGAEGPTGLLEKDVTLDLARRLAARLEQQGATVVLTRDEDRVLPLDDRTAIANHNRAELFVSIHLNASRAAKAYGAETYFLSPDATDDEARTLAALENKAYEGAAPRGGVGAGAGEGGLDRSLELILWDLAQNEFLGESARLAETVQRELNELAGTRDRGVRQAPFTVLMGATMPAILVEVGFVSNPDEETKLKDQGYRDKIAEALARAIATFRSESGAAADGAGARP